MTTKREIRGAEHRVIVLKVVGRYPDGRIKDCVVIHDDQTTEVKNGTEFITAWVPTKVLAKGD